MGVFRRLFIRRQSALAAVVLACARPAFAGTVAWNVDASGSWTTAANWSSTPSLPASPDDVTIDQPGNITVTLSNGNQSINSLIENDTLTILGGTLAIANSFQLDGTLNLQGGVLQNTVITPSPLAQINFLGGTLSNDTLSGNFTQNLNASVGLSGNITNDAVWNFNGGIVISNTTNLGGNGTIILSGPVFGGGALSIGSGQTIEGRGSVAFTNNSGTINANSANLTLSLNCASATLNNGILEATNGGNLPLLGTTTTTVLNNANGTIAATGSGNGTASRASISNMTISGGQLLTDASGRITVQSNCTLVGTTVVGNLLLSGSNITLSNDTLTGNITQLATPLMVSDTIVNNANWTQSGSGNSIIFPNALSSTVTINGSGMVTLSNSATQISGYVVFNVGPNETLQGSASFQYMSLNNSGVINANSANASITIDCQTNCSNNGTLEGTNGSRLFLNGFYTTFTNLNNANGVISASGSANGTSGRVTLDGIKVIGGQLFTDSSGQIFLQDETALSGVVACGNFIFLGTTDVENTTLSGSVIQSASGASLIGTVTNNANWTISGGGLAIANPSNLNGNGTINLSNSSIGSAAVTPRSQSGNATLDIASAQTIQGSGQVLSQVTLNNSGIITANSPTTSLAIRGPVTNDGTMQATSGASLSLSLVPSNFSAGVLTGGSWDVSNASILSAPMDIHTNAANITLDGPTARFSNSASGNISALANLTLNQGSLTITNGNNFTTSANVTNSGILIVGPGSTFSTPQLILHAGLLAGTGTISGSVVAGTSTHSIHPGLPGSNIAGILTLQSLTTNPNTVLGFNLTSSATSIAPSINDQLAITSPSGLILNGGAIQIMSIPAGDAALGYYQLLRYTTSFAGSVNSLTLPAPTNNIVFTLDTIHDPGFIDLHLGLLGDANGDGHVDLNDLDTVLNNLGTTTPNWTSGNFDGAPTIDLNDLNDVLNNLGASYANNSTVLAAEGLLKSESAPEPGTLGLLGLSSLLLLNRRHGAKTLPDE